MKLPVSAITFCGFPLRVPGPPHIRLSRCPGKRHDSPALCKLRVAGPGLQRHGFEGASSRAHGRNQGNSQTLKLCLFCGAVLLWVPNCGRQFQTPYLQTCACQAPINREDCRFSCSRGSASAGVGQQCFSLSQTHFEGMHGEETCANLAV